MTKRNVTTRSFFGNYVLTGNDETVMIAGCLDDIRLEGRYLPLPPATNGTQWGQATMARNVERNCPSNKPCANVICQEPFECVDLWNYYDCT